MPGVLVVSWANGHESRAVEQFNAARDAYARLKGVSCTGQDAGRDFRIARFAGPRSAAPGLHRTPGAITGAAGWFFDPQAPDDIASSLDHLAQLLETDADAAFNRLQGQYLIMNADLRSNRVKAAVDRLGLFPAYIAQREGTAWLCTSSVALAAALKPEVDVEALRALYFGGGIRAPRSAFAGIRKLTVGEQVTMEAGRADIRRAWTPFTVPSTVTGVEEAADEALRLVRRSCRSIQSLWPDPVCDLTSGLDSRLVIAVMAGEGRRLNITVSGYPDYVDVVISRRIAEHFGWQWTHFDRPEDWGRQRWPFFQQAVALVDGEIGGHTADGTIRLKRIVSDSFSASVSGGAGELYREFPWEHVLLRRGRTSRVNVDAYLRYRLFLSSRTEPSLFRRDWRAEFMADQRRRIEEILEIAPEASNTAKLDAVYVWRCGGHFGRYAGAAFPILPAPIPLATAEAIQFVMSLPPRLRSRAKLIRHMIARAHPEVATFPTCWGGSAEPMGLAHPVRSWPYLTETSRRWIRKFGIITIKRPIFRDPIMITPKPQFNTDFVEALEREGMLRTDSLRTADLYDPDGLSRFLARARDPGFNQHNILYAILSVEMLCRHCGLTPRGQSL